MDKRRMQSEYKRLKALLEGAAVPAQKIELLDPVVLNVAWQKEKLIEAMDDMSGQKLVSEYQNGNNQKGTHENPFFKAYINLWRAYICGVEKIEACLPKDNKQEVMRHESSVLDHVLRMKKAGA